MRQSAPFPGRDARAVTRHGTSYVPLNQDARRVLMFRRIKWVGNSKAVAMILVAVSILSVYPLVVERWAGPSPVLFVAGVMLGRFVGVGGYWTVRWARVPGLISILWKRVWCFSGVLHILVSANQLFYVAALTTAVPAAMVFLGETHPVIATLVLGWAYTRLGRPDRHSLGFSRSVWLMILGLCGAGLVVVSQGYGDHEIRWWGIVFALAQSLLVALKLISQLWWGATRSRDNEVAGVLFLGVVSDLVLGLSILAAAWLWGPFHAEVFLGGLACGFLVRAGGYILQRSSNIMSLTPNVNVLLLALPPLALVWLWLFGGDTDAHWGMLLVGGACLTLAGVLLNRRKSSHSGVSPIRRETQERRRK